MRYSYISKGAKEFESINLNEKIDAVLEDLALVVQEKGAQISTENLPTILGHRRQVQQLFYNHLSNALKYSKQDVAPAIQITCERVSGKDLRLMSPLLNKESTYYVIKVKDNGIGFAEENAERIFNVFTRLHGNHEYSGTGVGLAIAKKVVENHHGAIYAQGSLGKGAEFTIVWPI